MTRLAIAALIFMIVQAVLFGIGTILVLATPLHELAMQLLPVVIIGSSILALPLSWFIAPRLQQRYWSALGKSGDFISGPAQARSTKGDAI
jgi:hypothetical protein